MVIIIMNNNISNFNNDKTDNNKYHNNVSPFIRGMTFSTEV